MSAALAVKSMAPSRPVMPPRPLIGTTFRDRFVVTGMAILQVDLGQRTPARMVRTPATNSARRQDRRALEHKSMPRIAVFTKNRTNPAYEAARLGADRTAARLGATTTHYVPDRPDSVPEQIALIAHAVAERPDAAVFVPVDETAVNDAILGFDAAHIPLFNIITRTTAGWRVT